MRAGILLLLLPGISFPALAIAQTTHPAKPPKVDTQHVTPANNASIVRFYSTGEDEGFQAGRWSAPGPLHVIYSIGTHVEIPKERGQFAQSEQPLTQDDFSDIQLADDRRQRALLRVSAICISHCKGDPWHGLIALKAH